MKVIIVGFVIGFLSFVFTSIWKWKRKPKPVWGPSPLTKILLTSRYEQNFQNEWQAQWQSSENAYFKPEDLKSVWSKPMSAKDAMEIHKKLIEAGQITPRDQRPQPYQRLWTCDCQTTGNDGKLLDCKCSKKNRFSGTKQLNDHKGESTAVYENGFVRKRIFNDRVEFYDDHGRLHRDQILYPNVPNNSFTGAAVIGSNFHTVEFWKYGKFIRREHYTNDVLHSPKPDIPAYLEKNGTKTYYNHGKPARIEHTDGSVSHYDEEGFFTKRVYSTNFIPHRDDGPAITRAGGIKEYYQYGKLHRDNGPAVIKRSQKVTPYVGNYEVLDIKEWWTNGDCVKTEYYKDGQLHRLNGPAQIDMRTGSKLYFQRGKQIQFQLRSSKHVKDDTSKVARNQKPPR